MAMDVAFQPNAFQIDAFQTYTVLDASAAVQGMSNVQADAVRVLDAMAESNAVSTVSPAGHIIYLGSSAIVGASAFSASGHII